MSHTHTPTTVETLLGELEQACGALGVPATGPDHLEALLYLSADPTLAPRDAIRLAYGLT